MMSGKQKAFLLIIPPPDSTIFYDSCGGDYGE